MELSQLFDLPLPQPLVRKRPFAFSLNLTQLNRFALLECVCDIRFAQVVIFFALDLPLLGYMRHCPYIVALSLVLTVLVLFIQHVFLTKCSNLFLEEALFTLHIIIIISQ